MAKKSKKNERKKKLKSLVLLLFLTILLLSTSTYAWFTANRSVSIDAINVNVTAVSGLQISTDASEWKTLINNTDIRTPAAYTTHKNQLPTILSPVSTAGTTTGAYLNMFKGTVAGDPANGGQMSLTTVACDAEAAGSNGDFVAFDIFLKADEAGTVYLENGSGVTVTASQADKGLQYAARYAFVIEGNVNSNSEPSDAQALSGASSVIIVEPNYDAHKTSGVNNASTYYNISTTAAADGVAAVSYVGVKAAFSTPILLVNTNPGGTVDSTKFASITNLMRTNVAYSGASSSYAAYIGNTVQTHLLPVFTLAAGITKIRVYMWIEGQDIDCENADSGAYLTYKLGFTLDDDE